MDRMDITIRPARPGDIPRMAELLSELFALESDFTADLEKQRDGLSYLIADPTGRSRLFVAEYAGTIVGLASVQILISTAEGGRVGLVEDVIVDQRHRGAGIGTLLLDSIVVWSRKNGLRRLQLLSDEENLPAVNFYIRNGWSGTRLICLRHLL